MQCARPPAWEVGEMPVGPFASSVNRAGHTLRRRLWTAFSRSLFLPEQKSRGYPDLGLVDATSCPLGGARVRSLALKDHSPVIGMAHHLRGGPRPLPRGGLAQGWGQVLHPLLPLLFPPSCHPKWPLCSISEEVNGVKGGQTQGLSW